MIMSNETERKYQTGDEILGKNPKVSKRVVAQYRELEKHLKKLGVDTKPHYTLSPPLGGTISGLLKK